MNDAVEPGSNTDVRALLLDMLDYHRAVAAAKVAGLTGAQLAASVVPSGWSPGGLVNHLVNMERRWFNWGFLAEPVEDPYRDGWPGVWRDPELDAEALAALLRRRGAETRRIVQEHPLEEYARVGGRFLTPQEAPQLHWLLIHVVQEWARHLGHLDIARELTDGAVGKDG